MNGSQRLSFLRPDELAVIVDREHGVLRVRPDARFVVVEGRAVGRVGARERRELDRPWITFPDEQPVEILTAEDRRSGGPTAPAQGLFLVRVRYD